MVNTIFHATEKQLESAQAKVSYLGEQLKPIPTVVFHAKDPVLSIEHFLEVQPTPTPYPNDTLPYTKEFAVTPAEFRRMLLAVEPIVTAEHAAQGPEFLSFAVVREERSRVTGREYRVGPASAPQFYRALIDALDAANVVGRSTLERQFISVCPPSN